MLQLWWSCVPSGPIRSAVCPVSLEDPSWVRPTWDIYTASAQPWYSMDPALSKLKRLRAKNAVLKGRAAKGITLKVSEKGALSVYGLGRFPVTLYKEQWEKLLAMADDIHMFIVEREAELKTKAKEA